MDYTIFYKSKSSIVDKLDEFGEWDMLISAYNKAGRVKHIFDHIRSKEKYWIIQKEYGMPDSEIPHGSKVYVSKSYFESDVTNGFFSDMGISINELKNKRLCIDSTGFMRPHLMYLILYLHKNGIKEFDVLYSEPSHYTKGENTEFSKGGVTGVRLVHGFENPGGRDTSEDLLIIGAGFDQDLILEVDAHKEHASKIQIVGFPSLQADMYQQCRLRTYRAADDADIDLGPVFAPANDPFVTATVLSDLVEARNKESEITNLYLSPIGTKAQTIGFVLFFINECMNGQKNGGMIFPFSKSYSDESSQGISKVWSFHIELPDTVTDR